ARFAAAAARDHERRGAAAGRLGALLRTLDPDAVLGRGYARVSGAAGVISTAGAARRETRLTLHFADGEVTARPEGGPPSPGPKRRDPSSEGGQGSLF
ncbi:MAG: hypothetical protein ACU0BS_06680, partial [Hasllibacter sp.]